MHRKKSKRALFSVPIRQLIDKDLVPVSRGVTLDDLLQRFLSEDLQRVVVVNERGRPVGVIARSDLLMQAALGSTAIAGDLVSGMVTISSEKSLAEASALMVRRKLDGLLVTFEHRFAWLSPADVVKWVAEAGANGD